MKFESHVYVIGNSGKNAREITGGNLANEEVDFVACGAHYVCVKTKQRNLYTAGKNDEGQLCHGAGNNLEWEDALVVQDAAIKNKVISVACGYYHTMIVVENGDVWVAGYNHVDSRHTNLTQLVDHTTFGHEFIEVKARGQHNILRTKDKKLFVTGWNPYGQLGLGHQINLTTVEELKPQHFTGANVREVVCGYYWTTFVTNDNNAHSCGDNKRHQCGLPEAEEYLVPTLLEYPGLKNNVETVVCGHYYSLFMSCDKALFVSGSNIFVNGKDKALHKVELSPALERMGIHSIYGGFSHAFIVTTEQTIYATGNNTCYQCGLLVPPYANLERVQFPQNQGEVRIAAGWEHSVFYSVPRTTGDLLKEKLFSLVQTKVYCDLEIVSSITMWMDKH